MGVPTSQQVHFVLQRRHWIHRGIHSHWRAIRALRPIAFLLNRASTTLHGKTSICSRKRPSRQLIDLNARSVLPIHNSKFELALHPWDEPLRTRLHRKGQGTTPHRHNTDDRRDRFFSTNPTQSEPWWRKGVSIGDAILFENQSPGG